MIRALQPADLDSVCALWLAANLQAHSFIPAEYWKANQALVRKLLPQAEAYVYEKGGEILGFAGLDGEYIERPRPAYEPVYAAPHPGAPHEAVCRAGR